MLPGKEVEDLLKNFIKHVAKLYTGPNYNVETDSVIKQPEIKLSKALMAL